MPKMNRISRNGNCDYVKSIPGTLLFSDWRCVWMPGLWACFGGAITCANEWPGFSWDGCGQILHFKNKPRSGIFNSPRPGPGLSCICAVKCSSNTDGREKLTELDVASFREANLGIASWGQLGFFPLDTHSIFSNTTSPTLWHQLSVQRFNPVLTPSAWSWSDPMGEGPTGCPHFGRQLPHPGFLTNGL